MTMQTIRTERRDGRLDLWLARPDVRNAFNDTMVAELDALLSEAAADPALRVLVLRGEGKVFCAGADLNWMRAAADFGMAENLADARRMGGLFLKLESLPCPTVSVVQGAALGGATGLIAATDIALAAEDCKLGFTEVRLGIAPAVISGFVLRRIGRAAARRYFATGEVFEAPRAREIGLVSETFPAGELEGAVERVVKQILSVGPRASREAKALVDRVRERPLVHAVEDCAHLIAALRASPEGREGMSAFLEKRPPEWPETRA